MVALFSTSVVLHWDTKFLKLTYAEEGMQPEGEGQE